MENNEKEGRKTAQSVLEKGWLLRMMQRVMESDNYCEANGCEALQEDADITEAVRHIRKTHEERFYVFVHNGGGSFSECASPEAVFGPYSEERAREIRDALWDEIEKGRNDLHVVLNDMGRAKNDPESYINMVKDINAHS